MIGVCPSPFLLLMGPATHQSILPDIQDDQVAELRAIIILYVFLHLPVKHDIESVQ